MTAPALQNIWFPENSCEVYLAQASIAQKARGHMQKFSAIIADDHAIVRSGLRSALESPDLIEPDGIAVVA